MNLTINQPLPTMVTVTELVETTGISEYTIRGLIRDKKIIYIKSGHRFLINLEKFVEYLNTGDNN